MKLIRFLLSFIVGALLLGYTLHSFDIAETLDSMRNAQHERLFGAFCLLVLAYVVRAKRWTLWETSLSFWDSMKLILVGFMGNNILPARLGELLRAHCAAHKTGPNFGRTAALASISIERILDALCLSTIALFCLSILAVPLLFFIPLLAISLIFLLISALFFLATYRHNWLSKSINSLREKFPGHLTEFGTQKVQYFLEGLVLIRGKRIIAFSVLYTGIVWLIETFSCYLIGTSLFGDFSLSLSAIFLVVINFASLFPLTIGGIGAIEVAASAFLVSCGMSPEASFAAVLIQHGFQFSFTTLTGAFFYYSSKYYAISLKTGELPEKAPPRRASHGLQAAQLSERLGVTHSLSSNPSLSIVIPAYNEAGRLPKTILETINWCDENIESYEIIIADDGSTDETLTVARLFGEYSGHLRVIANSHLGKGAAVRIGMLNARGEYVLFMDADGATPLTELDKLRAKLDQGYDVAIGSRVVQRPGETVVTTSRHRKFIGRVFSGLVNIIVIAGIADTQCGFKMFSKEAAKRIFPLQKLNGFAFDVEILYLAKIFSFSVAEIPINWTNKEGSKVNMLSDSIKMFFDILRVRWLHKRTMMSLDTQKVKVDAQYR